MTATIEKDEIVIRMPFEKKPSQVSESGKTMRVFSTGGFVKTNLEVDGKPVSINLNATVPNPAFKKEKKGAVA
jgi:hypothetical protein